MLFNLTQTCIGQKTKLINPDVFLQDIATAVSKIEPEKTSKVQEAKSFLVSNPNCASASQLHSKMDEADKKYTKVEQLLQGSQDKYVPLFFWVHSKTEF